MIGLVLAAVAGALASTPPFCPGDNLDDAVRCLDWTFSAERKAQLYALPFDHVGIFDVPPPFEIRQKLHKQLIRTGFHFESTMPFVMQTYWLDMHKCPRMLKERIDYERAFNVASRRASLTAIAYGKNAEGIYEVHLDAPPEPNFDCTRGSTGE